MTRRYTPKRRTTPDRPGRDEMRCSQIGLRLKSVGGEEHVRRAQRIRDPRTRLLYLLDAADEIRPSLSEGARRWALPDTDWWRARIREDG